VVSQRGRLGRGGRGMLRCISDRKVKRPLFRFEFGNLGLLLSEEFSG